MSQEKSKPEFASAMAGYSRKEVDEFVDSLLTKFIELESYSNLAIREQQSLRDQIAKLQQKLSSAESPGYAQLGSQFEQTLRLAETEAGKLVNAAASEALKIRDQARAEADRSILEADRLANKLMVEAERASKTIRKEAETEADEIRQKLDAQKKQGEQELKDLKTKKSLIENEANNALAQQKAAIQRELETLSVTKSGLEKDIAELDAAIKQLREESEREFAERREAARVEVEAIYDAANEERIAATNHSELLISSAEQTLFEASDNASKIHTDAENMAIALIQDARQRNEALALKTLEMTKSMMADAEYQLAKLPEHRMQLERFLDETKNLLTPEQEMLLRRKQIQEFAHLTLEGELIDPEGN